MARVSSDCITAFTNLKMGKSHDSYLTFAFTDGGLCEISSVGPQGAGYEEFVASLPADQARFAVVAVKYETSGGGHREKLIFVNWIPGECHRTQKMMYAMFGNVVRSAMTGIHCVVQANSRSDLDWSEVRARVARFELDKAV